MKNYLNRAEKIFERINNLAKISEVENQITRTFGTKAFIEGQKLVLRWMNEAGLKTHIDNIGNVRGKLVSKMPNAKTFVIASHIDTVVNAGKFDGPLGVIMGIDLLENLAKTGLPFNIELIAFSDEEGVRFHTTFLGSKVVTGAFDKTLLDKKDESGTTLAQVIETFGGNIEQLNGDAIPAKNWLGYFEIHIEQGPVLYEKNIPVAVVSGIAGQKRVEIIFKGMAGHAGTVPMDMRQDALCAAAEFVLEAEKFALENKENLVATVGKLTVVNAASNVISGEVICSLDVRSADENTLSAAYESLKNLCEKIGKNRKIDINWQLIQATKPVICDENLSQMLALSIQKLGFEVVKLVSGAGHDGVPISEISPVSMLFVRCFKGISHNPLENVELKDVAVAIEVSDNFMQELINHIGT